MAARKSPHLHFAHPLQDELPWTAELRDPQPSPRLGGSGCSVTWSDAGYHWGSRGAPALTGLQRIRWSVLGSPTNAHSLPRKAGTGLGPGSVGSVVGASCMAQSRTLSAWPGAREASQSHGKRCVCRPPRPTPPLGAGSGGGHVQTRGAGLSPGHSSGKQKGQAGIGRVNRGVE